ncbi:MAG TPA: hypothetical protein VF669_07255 [Tepidisphaeraceae bacterium]
MKKRSRTEEAIVGRRAAGLLKPVSVTYQKGKGFKKMIGWTRNESGKKQPKIWWLGHVEQQARELASLLNTFYLTQVDEGMSECWDEDALFTATEIIGVRRTVWQQVLDDARRVLEQQKDSGGSDTKGGRRAAVSAVPKQSAGEKTLYQAITAYTEHLKGKRKSDRHKQRATQVVEVNLKRVRKDCPLSLIDFVWIDSLCDHFKGRPKNLKDGKTLAPASVKNILTYLRLFFTWLDDTEFGGWQAPRKLLKCFRLRVADLMTPAELRDWAPFSSLILKP